MALKKIITVIVSSLVTLLAVEVFLRLSLHQAEQPEKNETHASIKFTDPSQYLNPHPILGWTHKPSIDEKYEGPCFSGDITYNSVGFRDFRC